MNNDQYMNIILIMYIYILINSYINIILISMNINMNEYIIYACECALVFVYAVYPVGY